MTKEEFLEGNILTAGDLKEAIKDIDDSLDVRLVFSSDNNDAYDKYSDHVVWAWVGEHTIENKEVFFILSPLLVPSVIDCLEN